ncbi:hypothetical protein C5L14_26480 [Labrys okinawensis]|uniref:Uncharacterized protein n=1 Tax=Labrys okinawensis TaxID=346911 RepID=A0A2S9Q4X2_9HYPH|nr:hypothetical protein [Labrys okinawensis]PRH84402.1 hypothetical protein C5L14_26480 [Labrys okinawensis]
MQRWKAGQGGQICDSQGAFFCKGAALPGNHSATMRPGASAVSGNMPAISLADRQKMATAKRLNGTGARIASRAGRFLADEGSTEALTSHPGMIQIFGSWNVKRRRPPWLSQRKFPGSS